MNAENVKRETPLHQAASEGILMNETLQNVFFFHLRLFFLLFPGRKKVVLALIKLGANIFAENSKKETPRDLAIKRVSLVTILSNTKLKTN